jgi:hypothetical protein
MISHEPEAAETRVTEPAWNDVNQRNRKHIARLCTLDMHGTSQGMHRACRWTFASRILTSARRVELKIARIPCLEHDNLPWSSSSRHRNIRVQAIDTIRVFTARPPLTTNLDNLVLRPTSPASKHQCGYAD